MYNEYEEMVKQAYEEAYDMAYEDAYEDVCNEIAKQAEAAEFDEMVKCAYDEICGMEKEALWNENWKQDPAKLHATKSLLKNTTRANSVLGALNTGEENMRRKIKETGSQLEVLRRAKESAIFNNRPFGEKASKRLKDLQSNYDTMNKKLKSMNTMSGAIYGSYFGGGVGV